MQNCDLFLNVTDLYALYDFFHFFAYIQACLIAKRMLERASSRNHVIYPLPNQNLRDPQVEKKKYEAKLKPGIEYLHVINMFTS